MAERDLSGFNPGERAVVSNDKQQVIDSAKTREDRVLETLLRYWPGDLITSAALAGALFGGVESAEGRQRVHAMRAAKVKMETHGVFKVAEDVWREGVKHSLYVLRDAGNFKHMSKADVAYWFFNHNGNAPVTDIGGQRFIEEQLGEDDKI